MHTTTPSPEVTQSLQLHWQQLLQRQRGRNGYRGRAAWLQAPLRLLLECAAPAGQAPASSLTLHIAPQAVHTYYVWAGKRYVLADAASDAVWLKGALDLCRCKTAYIRTQDDVATYK
jgi:hypothetical protein